MSLKRKIILFFIFLILLTVFSLSVYMYTATNNIVEESEQSLTMMLTNALENEVQDRLDITEVNVRSIVVNQRVQKLFAQRDREGLIEYLLPMYEGLKESFPQAQFHLPDSTSFLRLHKLEKYGDSLKAFRKTVNKANETKEMIKGIEEGVAGFGCRVVMPVFYEGEHIGSFEYGKAFEYDFLQALKKTYGGEFFIYKFGENGEAVYVSSTTDSEARYKEGALGSLRAGKTMHTLSQNKKYNNYMIPFKAYDGSTLGFIQAQMDRSHILKQNGVVIRNMILFIGAILLVISVLAYFFLMKAFKPLYLLMEDARVIAQGDFTKQMDMDSKDEIGLLSRSLSHISESLRKMLASIGSMACNVAGHSETLSASSQQMSASCEEVNRNILDVSNLAAEQLSAVEYSKEDVNFMTEGITELNSSVKRINESMSSVIQSTNEGIHASKMIEDKILNLKSSSEKSSDNIDKLNRSSKEIGDIITTIQGIADETNLLALNASIEAARAGEAGRGFSVVAGEVRKLAEQSRNSTGRIDALIKEIQSDITMVVSSMKESNKEVAEGVSVVKNSSEKFKEIENEVSITVDQIAEITKMVETIYGKIDRIMDSFEGIVEKSNDTMGRVNSVKNTSQDQSLAMTEIANSTIHLAELASELMEAVAQFKY